MACLFEWILLVFYGNFGVRQLRKFIEIEALKDFALIGLVIDSNRTIDIAQAENLSIFLLLAEVG